MAPADHVPAYVIAAFHSVCGPVQVSLPGHICAVVVTTLVLEGWSSQLDPSHSVLAEVRRHKSHKQSK